MIIFENHEFNNVLYISVMSLYIGKMHLVTKQQHEPVPEASLFQECEILSSDGYLIGTLDQKLSLT